MKKVYFAGTFEIDDNDLPLILRLKNDYRAKILGSAKLMLNYCSHLVVDNFQYIGPFYCEEAAPGIYTSTDCKVVVEQERKQVEACDLFICVFTDWPSVGTIVELEWAIEQGKEILLSSFWEPPTF